MASLTIELPDRVVRQLETMAASRGYGCVEDFLRDAIIAATAESAGRSLAEFEFCLSKEMGFLPRDANRQSPQGPGVDQA
jgi:hypothetical protein